MDSISENTLASHSPLLRQPSRVRKISIDCQSNYKDVDMNGNVPVRRRMSSCSEDPVQMAQLQGVLVEAITKSRESASSDARSSGAWENAFLEHIQSLIKTVKVSDSLSDCINDELLDSDVTQGNNDGSATTNSCFAVNRSCSYKNAILGGKGISVTDREPLLSQNGPRRKISTAGLENMNFNSPRRKVSTAGLENMNFCRRNSGFSGEGRRCSVTSQSTDRRSSVVANPTLARRNSVVSGGRRSSVVTLGRRNSFAHAPGQGPPPSRRMSTTHNVLDNRTNPPVRRRSSVVKPSCFNVSKISSLQRRLHRIYRQRRRKQRGQVNIADVRTAMGVENDENSEENREENSDSSDSGVDKSAESESDNALDNTEYDNDSSKNDIQNDVTEIDENCNVELSSHLSCSVTSVTSIGDESYIGDDTGDMVSLVPEQDQGPIPSPRRKTSIQIRSWEISRQLRQRRRLKRKSGTESDII